MTSLLAWRWRGSRTRTTTSVGSSGAASVSSPRRRRRRRRRREPPSASVSVSSPDLSSAAGSPSSDAVSPPSTSASVAGSSSEPVRRRRRPPRRRRRRRVPDSAASDSSSVSDSLCLVLFGLVRYGAIVAVGRSIVSSTARNRRCSADVVSLGGTSATSGSASSAGSTWVGSASTGSRLRRGLLDERWGPGRRRRPDQAWRRLAAPAGRRWSGRAARRRTPRPPERPSSSRACAGPGPAARDRQRRLLASGATASPGRTKVPVRPAPSPRPRPSAHGCRRLGRGGELRPRCRLDRRVLDRRRVRRGGGRSSRPAGRATPARSARSGLRWGLFGGGLVRVGLVVEHLDSFNGATRTRSFALRPSGRAAEACGGRCVGPVLPRSSGAPVTLESLLVAVKSPATGHRDQAHRAPEPHPVSHTLRKFPAWRFPRAAGSGSRSSEPAPPPGPAGPARAGSAPGPPPGRTQSRSAPYRSARRPVGPAAYRAPGASPARRRPLSRVTTAARASNSRTPFLVIRSPGRPGRRGRRAPPSQVGGGDADQVDPPARAGQQVGQRARRATDDLDDVQPGRQRRVQGGLHRRRVAGLGQSDLQVLGLAGRAGRRRVGVGDARVRARTRTSRPSAPRPAAAPARRPGRSRGGW